MICRGCGGACSEDMRLCPNCGTALLREPIATAAAVEQQKPVSKKSRLSVFLTGLGLYLLVAAVVFAVTGLVTGSSYENRYLLVGGQDGALHLLTPAGGILTLPEEGERFHDAAQTAQVAKDGGAAAFLLRDGGSETGTLYYAANGEIRAPLQEDVSAFLLADGGEHLLFATELQNDTGALYLWTARDDSVRRLASDAVVFHGEGSIRSAAISARGRRIAFVTGNPGAQPLQLSAYSWSESKPPEQLGENRIPLALTERGDGLLYAEIDWQANTYGCYIKKGGEAVKLFAEQDYPNLLAALTVSTELGDVFYSTPEGFFHWQSRDGIARITDQPGALLGGGAQRSVGYVDAPAYLIQSDGALLSIGSNDTPDRVATDVLRAAAGNEGVCYETEYGLFHWRRTSRGSVVLDIAQSVSWFDLPIGEDRIYYTQPDTDLYAAQPGNPPLLIAYQVEAAALQPQTDRLYFIRQDSHLYCMDRGQSPLLVLEEVQAPIACLQP